MLVLVLDLSRKRGEVVADLGTNGIKELGFLAGLVFYTSNYQYESLVRRWTIKMSWALAENGPGMFF